MSEPTDTRSFTVLRLLTSVTVGILAAGAFLGNVIIALIAALALAVLSMLTPPVKSPSNKWPIIVWVVIIALVGLGFFLIPDDFQLTGATLIGLISAGAWWVASATTSVTTTSPTPRPEREIPAASPQTFPDSAETHTALLPRDEHAPRR